MFAILHGIVDGVQDDKLSEVSIKQMAEDEFTRRVSFEMQEYLKETATFQVRMHILSSISHNTFITVYTYFVINLLYRRRLRSVMGQSNLYRCLTSGSR